MEKYVLTSKKLIFWACGKSLEKSTPVKAQIFPNFETSPLLKISKKNLEISKFSHPCYFQIIILQGIHGNAFFQNKFGNLEKGLDTATTHCAILGLSHN